jgi:cytochrome c556
MRKSSVSTRVLCVVLVAAMAGATATLGAQRRRGADNASQGAPVATNTILQNPDAYYGKSITVSAGIEQVLSRTAFVVDQRTAVSANEMRAAGQPLLVIAPYLNAALDLKHYLLLRGQVVKFDPAAIARLAPDYTLDLAPDLGAKFQGQPVLLATAVIDSTYIDLAKKPIPPPSATDVALSAAMKIINPALSSLRAAAQDAKPDAVKETAATLKAAFAEAAVLFDANKSPAAARAREAAGQIAAVESAAEAGNWDAAKAAAGTLNQSCQSCHTTYRERQEDGTFRLKRGSI